MNHCGAYGACVCVGVWRVSGGTCVGLGRVSCVGGACVVCRVGRVSGGACVGWGVCRVGRVSGGVCSGNL